jgi:hypothetical protein
MDLIGAKPVPAATKIIGFFESSLKKKLPSGPSKRRISFSLSAISFTPKT